MSRARASARDDSILARLLSPQSALSLRASAPQYRVHCTAGSVPMVPPAHNARARSLHTHGRASLAPSSSCPIGSRDVGAAHGLICFVIAAASALPHLLLEDLRRSRGHVHVALLVHAAHASALWRRRASARRPRCRCANPSAPGGGAAAPRARSHSLSPPLSLSLHSLSLSHFHPHSHYPCHSHSHYHSHSRSLSFSLSVSFLQSPSLPLWFSLSPSV